ncbi:hypothetical protein LAZ67_9003644 [Cordylochernes scorpioides]|uniref:Uncharacterized protein n=1 Tax=Cordylochernes scorpioides TaxID=51811 RepID=A0ABY6KV39_9ARAC|nr:hypothetical protein LAZ67_9003644 [Cordylochernes scorpioides]
MEELNKIREAARGRFTEQVNSLNTELRDPLIDKSGIYAKFDRLEYLHLELVALNERCQGILLAQEAISDDEIDREFGDCEVYIMERFYLEARIRVMRERERDAQAKTSQIPPGASSASPNSETDNQKVIKLQTTSTSLSKSPEESMKNEIEGVEKEDSVKTARATDVKPALAKARMLKEACSAPSIIDIEYEGKKGAVNAIKEKELNAAVEGGEGKETEAAVKCNEVKDSETAVDSFVGVKEAEAKDKAKETEAKPDKVNSKDGDKGDEVKESEGQKAGDEGDGKKDSEAELKSEGAKDSEAEPKGEEVKNSGAESKDYKAKDSEPKGDGVKDSEAEPKGEGVKDSEAKPKDEGMNDSEDRPKGDGVKDSEAKPKGAGVKDSKAKPKGEGVKDSEAKPKGDGVNDSEAKHKGDGVNDSEAKPKGDGVKDSEAKPKDEGMKDSEDQPKSDGVKDSEAKPKGDGVKDSGTAIKGYEPVNHSRAVAEGADQVKISDDETESIDDNEENEERVGKVQASRKLVEARPTGDTESKIKDNYKGTESQDLKTINKSDYAEQGTDSKVEEEKLDAEQGTDSKVEEKLDAEQGTDSKVEEEKLDAEQGTDSKVEEKLDVEQGTDSKVEEKLDAEQGTDSKVKEEKLDAEQGTDPKVEENLDAEQGTESKVEGKIIDPKDWLSEGFIEGVTENPPEVKGHYLPRHLLLKSESKTTPIRPVFDDASCRGRNGLSLRRYLKRRPILLRRIPEIRIKLRENKFGVLADMRRYFQVMAIKENDWDYLRFLWKKKMDAYGAISGGVYGEGAAIVQMAHSLGGEGFDDFTDGDIADNITAKVIREGLALGRKLGNHFMQNDTNVERALRFQRDINRCLAQCEEVYKDLTKNSKNIYRRDIESEI